MEPVGNTVGLEINSPPIRRICEQFYATSNALALSSTMDLFSDNAYVESVKM